MQLRRARVRTRVVLGFGFVSLVLTASMAAISFSLVRASLLKDRYEAVAEQAYTNARIVRSRLTAGDLDIPALLSGLRVDSEGDVLLRREGRWYASSLTADRSQVPGSLRAGVDAGHAGRQVVAGPDEPVMVVGVPIGDLDAAYFELSPLADLDRTLRILATSLGLAAVVAAALGAVTGALLAGQIVRPLQAASAVATEIADGRPDVRLDAANDPDLEPLATSFNRMVDALADRARRESRFASDVSHDLRGPLMALASAVSVVNRHRDSLPTESLAAIDALDTQVQSFSALVLDLLEISRFEAGTAALVAREIDAVELVRAILAERGDDTVVHATADEELRVVLDPRRIHQVMTNILDNARNYAGGATAVTVSAVNGQGVRIAIDDAGPGVPPDERDTIFDRYERGRAGTAPDAVRGTGLGLALARQHVELHGGTLAVGDAPGGGARFLIDLPRHPS
jgi:two-component system sensor histidine kinase MtrB